MRPGARMDTVPTAIAAWGLLEHPVKSEHSGVPEHRGEIAPLLCCAPQSSTLRDYPRGFPFIVRVQSASSIRSAISRR
jgi:hypothetical protein